MGGKEDGLAGGKTIRADLKGSRKRGCYGLHNPLPTAPRRIRYEGSRPSLISVRSRTPLGKTRKERRDEERKPPSSKTLLGKGLALKDPPALVMKVESAQVASGNPRRHPTKRKGPTHVGPWLASLTTVNQRFIDSWARRYSTVRRTLVSTSIWFTTVLRAWMTVPWSRPPKAWPIDTRDMPVSWVARYMAT